MAYVPPFSRPHKVKREPVGWMGPAQGSGLTSRGKGRWDVIDSQGTRIAAGFDTRDYANRWIDSFNLLRAGHHLNDHDHEWFSWHWLSWLPKRDHSRTNHKKNGPPTVTRDSAPWGPDCPPGQPPAPQAPRKHTGPSDGDRADK